MKHLLGYLLYLANGTSAYYSKSINFYPLKKRLLKRYGNYIGNDYQHIKEYCWTCNGTGMYSKNNPCYNCYGTGIYKEFITILHIYKLGKYTFHIPFKKIHNYRPEFKRVLRRKTIDGYISHKGYKYSAGREAALLLFLIFDIKTLKKEFGRIGQRKNVLYPISFLERLYFFIKAYVRKIKFNKIYCKPVIGRNINIIKDDELPF